MRVTAILMQLVAQVNSLPGAVGAEREWKQGPLFGGTLGGGSQGHLLRRWVSSSSFR